MRIPEFLRRLFGLRKRPEGPRGRIEIYVGNLSYEMTTEQLRKAFAAYGEVSGARVVENPGNHKSKGYGFVEMVYRSEAEAAIAAFNDKVVMGRKLRVNEARESRRESRGAPGEQKRSHHRHGRRRKPNGGEPPAAADTATA